jgi:transaldolase/glucose-6-phosphate isomerase
MMAAGSPNRIKRLQDFGQSVWLDYLRRSLIDDGGIQRLIDEDGLRGLTSNPAIFEKAIAGSTDYTAALQTIEHVLDREAGDIYESLAIDDIQRAADVFRPVYDATDGRDGFVSLEVSPYLGRDTAGTIEEARRLWGTVGRDNVMVKVPGTPEGLPAIQQLTSEGINVNITLLFGLELYEQVVEAFLTGLEQRLAAGASIDRMASVASFFVSRVDTAADARLSDRLEQSPSPRDRARLQGLLGRVAIANAKLAYERYEALFAGQRWEALARRGARTQRLLWASTSTKNPSYRDVMYIEELIGPDTVTTVPPATLDAFREHGELRPSLAEDVEEAHDVIETL